MAIQAKSLALGLGATVVVAVAASAAYLVLRGGGGGPSLLDDLDAGQTLAVSEVRDLDKLAERGLQSLASLPALPAFKLPTREEITAKLGGDPGKAEAWHAWGIDPQLGVALVVDKRVVRQRGSTPEAVPVLLARVTDRAKLQAALGKAGVAITLGKQVGAVQEVTIAGQRALLATRGETLALLPQAGAAADDTALRVAFEAFLRTDGAKLAAAEPFRQSRREAGSAQFFAWADVAGIGQFESRTKDRADISFFTGLFPRAALWFGDDSGARLDATETGRLALAEIAKPKRNPPKCARLIPKTGWAALRGSVNLVDVVGGAGKLLPPSTPATVRGSLGMSTSMLAFVGLSWQEITDAFSGHACAGADVASVVGAVTSGGKAMPAWLGALGIVDAPKADALLNKLVELAKGKGGIVASEIKVGSSKGWALTAGPVTVAVARIDDVLLFGPSVAALEAAANRSPGESLAATPLKEALDGNVIMGFGADFQAGVDAAKAMLAVSGKKPAEQEMLAKLNAQLAGQRYAGGALSLDDRGLLLHTFGDPLLKSGAGLVVPVLAAVAIPNFLRYNRKSRSVEADVHLRQIAVAAVAHFGTPLAEGGGGCKFPQSVPPNPSKSCCDPSVDKDGDHRCDAGSFVTNPTWDLLKFSPGVGAYQYAFASSGSLGDAEFTVSAYGDSDCDGEVATFSLHGKGVGAEDGSCSAKLDGGVVRDHEDD